VDGTVNDRFWGDDMTTNGGFHRHGDSHGRVGIGVIGCGNITEFRHLPALVSEVPEFDLRALCNRSETNLHHLGERFRVAPVDRYTDYRKLLARDDIQAILVAASPAANLEIVPEAASAGKHVFVEKPMAETATQARIMIDAVKRAGVKLQVGFNKRYYYAYRTAFDLIRSGRVDSPTGVNARFWFPPSRREMPARKQVVSQNGIHVLDLVQFFLGPAAEVFAREMIVQRRVTVAATLVFQTGAVGNVLLSSGASWSYPNEWLEVVGSNGCCLSAENGRRVTLFVEGQPGLYFEESISAHWLTGHGEAGFTSQLKAFARSIQIDAPTEVGPLDGLRSVLLAEAIEESLETRRPVVMMPV
jgi:myo-inositol 2-dehydrogenase/D-chiro-inositol 1-dehydrogenase